MPSKYSALLVKLALAIAMPLLVPAAAMAEGRCPPGQYPIGGQGMAGCAPIPGAGGGEGSGPTPTGRWIKTWGAISTASNGASGRITGKFKKRDAEKAALAQCTESGGNDCRVSFTYKNQCVAAAIATSGFGGTKFVSAESEEIAGKEAVGTCQASGGRGCEVIYSACSAPYFEKY